MQKKTEKIDCTFQIQGVEVEVGFSFTCKCGEEITDMEFIDVDPCDVSEDNALEIWDNNTNDTYAICPRCGRKYLLDKDSFYDDDINVGKMMLVSE
jgi:hypothetical protein